MTTNLFEFANDIPGVLFQFAVHPDGRQALEFVGGRSEEIFGLAPDPATFMQRFRAGMPTDELERLDASLALAVRTRKTWQFSGRFLRIDPSDGALTTRWWRASSSPRLRQDGSLLFSGILMDVTEQHMADERIESSEARYRLLFENMTSAFALHEIICDEAGRPVDYRYLEINPAFERLTGVPATALLGKTLKEVMPQTEPYWIETFGQVALEGVPMAYENYSRELGHWYDTFVFSPERGRFAVVFHDVSARKAAELALKDRESLLSSVAANAPGGLLKLRIEAGRTPALLYMSQGFLARFGLQPIGGEPAAAEAVDCMAAADRERLRRRLEHAALQAEMRQAGPPLRMADTFPVHVPGDGERWCQAQAQVDRDGDAFIVYAYVTDITEQRRSEQLSREAAVARDANQAKTRFLSRMSHELRTPLNAILGYVQNLQIDGSQPLTADQSRKVEIMGRSGELLLTLIDDVLDLARIEEGGLSLSFEPVDLFAEVRLAIEQVSPMAERMGIGLQVRAPDPPVFVKADRTRLGEVFANLLTNAIKYNRRGGSVTVAMARAHVDDGTLGIEVSDTGLGMTEQQVAQLFTPFNRLGREHSRIQGTGIGLTIVDRLVRLMNGRISVESRPNAGSRFSLWLPASRLEPPRASAGPTAPRSAAPRRATDLRVLYVEDNEVNRLLLQESLPLTSQVQVAVASSGEEALRALEQSRPDLLIMDLHLGDMTAAELIEHLEARPEWRDLPRMLLTADAFFIARSDATSLGCLACLHKPLRFHELARAIEQYFPGTVR